MQYSRVGLYVPRKIKPRPTSKSKEKKVDWVNIALFVLLFIVIVMFVFTK